MAETITYSLIGKEDLAIQGSASDTSFTATLPDGTVVTLTKLSLDALKAYANVNVNLNQLLGAILEVLSANPADTQGRVWYISGVVRYGTGTGIKELVDLAAAQSLTNKTLTSPKLVTSILDTNGNTILLITPATSPVNYLELLNAATGTRPTIRATGTDANIDIELTPKGSGVVTINGVQVLTTASRQMLQNLQLVKSAANLTVNKIGGNYYSINGSVYQMTAAAPTLAVGATLVEGGLPAASTTYFIYIDTSGALAASATGYTVNANGEPLRNGDNTRLLVGMARTTAGSAWADTLTQRFVVSYFNRRSIPARNKFTATRSTTSTTYTEINIEIRTEFLTWADEAVCYGLSGSSLNPGAGAPSVNTSFGIDSATVAEDEFNAPQFGGNWNGYVGLSGAKFLSEGNHFITLLGNTSSGTAQWNNAALDILIRG